MIRVLLFGDFWNRQPLAYGQILERIGDRIGLVEDPAEAQIALFSNIKDLTAHGARLGTLIATRPELRAVLLSEEPFWDTCWMTDPFSPFQTWREGPVPFPFAVLNQYTARFFDHRALPYFLLTDPRYIAHYRPLFDRNAGFNAAGWLKRWQKVEWDAAFVAERRDGPRHEPAFPDRGVWGLSVLRSRIARHCRGRVLRAGKGWEDAAPRGELADWHADKLGRLDLRCRYVSAIENTHMQTYVTEKIFDAFAVGGVPLYVAGKGHRVFGFADEAAWQNLYLRLPLAKAPKPQPFDATEAISADLAGAYAATQNRLARLFADTEVVDRALDRLADGIVAALTRLLS